MTTTPDIATAESATFTPCLKHTFSVRPAIDAVAADPHAEPFDATLDSVSDLPTSGREARRRPFSMIFKCTHDVPQRTYELTHAELGSFLLFLVPVGRDDDGLLLEAVCN